MTIPLTMGDPDYAALFAAERKKLLALLNGLAAEEWEQPSPCPGWTLIDVANHLLGDDLGLLARNRDGHVRLRPPPSAESGDGFARWLDVVQGEWVEGARRLSPRLTLDLLAWTGPQVVALLSEQDPNVVDGSVSWASDNPVPRWLDQARELSEHWIHRQQLLATVNRPADLSAPIAGAVIDALRWAYPRALDRFERPIGDTIDVIVDGEIKRTWHLVHDGSAWQFGHESGTLIAELRLTSDQLWRSLTNNLASTERAQLEAQGDADAIEVLLGARAIIGVPK